MPFSKESKDSDFPFECPLKRWFIFLHIYYTFRRENFTKIYRLNYINERFIVLTGIGKGKLKVAFFCI